MFAGFTWNLHWHAYPESPVKSQEASEGNHDAAYSRQAGLGENYYLRLRDSWPSAVPSCSVSQTPLRVKLSRRSRSFPAGVRRRVNKA